MPKSLKFEPPYVGCYHKNDFRLTLQGKQEITIIS